MAINRCNGCRRKARDGFLKQRQAGLARNQGQHQVAWMLHGKGDF